MSLPPIECKYITADFVHDWKSSNGNPSSKLPDPVPILRFVYELCWNIVRGELPLQKCRPILDSVEFLDKPTKQEVGSTFADIVSQMALLTLNGDSRSRLVKLVKLLVESTVVPLRLLHERCEEEFLWEAELSKIKAPELKNKEVRVDTRLLDQQTKFNLIREESEGYANLTCLSRGKGIHFPPCYILNVCGIRILIDCPIDLSALAAFSPLCYDTSIAYNEQDSSYSVGKSGDLHSAGPKRQKFEKPLNANDLIHAEPWYKTVTSLHLWNVSFIDVVLITSPMGMLGLPFLTRLDGFSAKIYATEAAAKLGKLMMDSIVSIHTEFKQFYGPEGSDTPQWMNWEELQLLPFALREKVVGMDGVELGGWMELYSAADIESCVKKVQTLKYAEEVCYNGTVIVKAFSSGSEIGATNWTLKCPDRSVACISNSIFAPHHAQEFDYCSLKGNDVIIYMDFSFLDVHEPDASDSYSALSGTPAPLSDFKNFLCHTDESLKETEKLDFICSCAIDSVKAGGSVLIPIDRLGIVLQLLEQLGVQLEASMLKVPMYIISSIAEELLTFTNVIPEWLSKQRQEKLFSGESLFAHVELLKEGRLQAYPTLSSPKLLSNWQEPCIVFCPHWNLRLGPAVHLLHRWKGDQNSLLVLEESVDSELDLLPFSTGMKMKVLQCSFLSGITLKMVQPLLELLQPKLVLLPECLPFQKHQRFVFSTEKNPPPILQYYNVNETVEVSGKEDHTEEVDLSAEVVSRLQWRTNPVHEKNTSIARLKGNIAMVDGRCRILVSSDKDDGQVLFRWGLTEREKLLNQLSKMGIGGTLEDKKEESGRNGMVVHIYSPDKAFVEVGNEEIVIVAANQGLGSLIFEAISSVLDGI